MSRSQQVANMAKASMLTLGRQSLFSSLVFLSLTFLKQTHTNSYHATLYTTTLLVNPFLTVHCVEFLPTSVPQIPHEHLPVFCTPLQLSQLLVIITMVFFIFTFIPLISIPHFHRLSLLISWHCTYNTKITIFQVHLQ